MPIADREIWFQNLVLPSSIASVTLRQRGTESIPLGRDLSESVGLAVVQLLRWQSGACFAALLSSTQVRLDARAVPQPRHVESRLRFQPALVQLRLAGAFHRPIDSLDRGNLNV